MRPRQTRGSTHPCTATRSRSCAASSTYHRDTLRRKCAGLTQEQLAQTLPPSDMTLGGLMKHLALVESQWFDYFFRDLALAPPFDTVDWDADPDWEFDTARDDSPEELRALFDEAVRPCGRRRRRRARRAAGSTKSRRA